MPQKKVTITQPSPFPPMFYFHRMLQSDTAVLLNSAQFVRKTGTSQRHYDIIINKKRHRMVIPVKHDGNQSVALFEAQIDYSQDWVGQHLRTLKMAYGKRPFFKDVFPAVESIFEERHQTLGLFSVEGIWQVFSLIGERPRLVSDTMLMEPIGGDPSTWMLSLTLACNGTEYLCGKSASENYMDEKQFLSRGVRPVVHSFVEPFYTETHDEHNLSVLDVLFNVGPGIKKLLGVRA